MRRITGVVVLSLDGVMQAPGGPSEDYTGGFDEGVGCSGSATTAYLKPSACHSAGVPTPIVAPGR
jgi:hypothetical protein